MRLLGDTETLIMHVNWKKIERKKKQNVPVSLPFLIKIFDKTH